MCRETRAQHSEPPPTTTLIMSYIPKAPSSNTSTDSDHKPIVSLLLDLQYNVDGTSILDILFCAVGILYIITRFLLPVNCSIMYTKYGTE